MSEFVLSLDLCSQMAKAAEKAQQGTGVNITLAIADRHGTLRYFYRYGDAILPSVDIAQKKAYTAAVLGQTTREFGKIAQVGESAFGINITHPQLVIFGGGFPLKVNGKTVGGLGVSGGSVEEDEKIAEAALEAFSKAAG